MPYPTYTVNGVAMYDPWGRWHEHREQATLPVHPGLRSASLNLAGVGGEVPLPMAPIQAVDFVLHMVVNAVDQFGERPDTYAGRLHQLNENISELIRIFQTPQMTQGGFASISLHHDEVAGVNTSGRLEASTETEFEPGADYCTIRFIFRLPYGVWRGKLIKETFTGSGAKKVAGLARSSAPIDAPHLVLRGPFTGASVTNEFGNGFSLNRTVGADQAVAVNTRLWAVSPAFPAPAGEAITLPGGQYIHAPDMSSVGLTSAVALTLLPRPAGGPTVNVSFIGGSGDSAIHIHTTEAYY